MSKLEQDAEVEWDENLASYLLIDDIRGKDLRLQMPGPSELKMRIYSNPELWKGTEHEELLNNRSKVFMEQYNAMQAAKKAASALPPKPAKPKRGEATQM